MKQRFQPGSFVWTFDQYGIGQISSIERDQCNVKFFKSISDEVEGVYSTTKLEPAILSPQTRAYHRDEDGILVRRSNYRLCLGQRPNVLRRPVSKRQRIADQREGHPSSLPAARG